LVRGWQIQEELGKCRIATYIEEVSKPRGLAVRISEFICGRDASGGVRGSHDGRNGKIPRFFGETPRIVRKIKMAISFGVALGLEAPPGPNGGDVPIGGGGCFPKEKGGAKIPRGGGGGGWGPPGSQFLGGGVSGGEGWGRGGPGNPAF